MESQNADAHLDLGNAFFRLGRKEEAIAAFKSAIALRPDYAAAYGNLSLALQSAGRLDEAIDALRHVTVLNPKQFEAHAALGTLLHRASRLQDAASSYRRALAIRADSAETLSNLGNALRELGEISEAITLLRRVIELRPTHPAAHMHLGIALGAAQQWEQAIAAYQRAIQLDPTFPDAYNNLANALKECGRIVESVAAYRHALALRTDRPDIASNLIYELHFHPEYDSQAILEEHTKWNERYALPPAKFIKPHRNDPSADRRLRIGYVSPDFKHHVVGFNLLPLFRHRNHDHFHVTCYANMTVSDALTDTFRTLSGEWRSIAGTSDADVAEMIARDQIDILVDLSLHMERNRLLVFARKPAPVQVTFAGYPGTTGLTAIDYRLTDPYLDPPGTRDDLYSEKSIRLAHSFWCYSPIGNEPPVNPLPAMTNGFVTFGCLSTQTKVNDKVLQLWGRVLRAVPGSKLLLLAPSEGYRQWIADQSGVDLNRIEFIERGARLKYLEAFHRIDIGLDSFPYNGHTTGLDSWWMGVPVVSLCGETIASRAGFSHASNLGLTDLVATTPDQFVQIATDLASNLSRLSELRSTMRARMSTSPLMDAARFARDIESAYRDIWRRWCTDHTSG